MKNKSFSDIFRMGLDIMDTPIFSSFFDESIEVNPEENETTLTLAIPGYGEKDVKITVQKEKLFVYLKKKLFKTYFLTKSVNKDNVTAKVKDGILTLKFKRDTVPKEEEIEITT